MVSTNFKIKIDYVKGLSVMLGLLTFVLIFISHVQLNSFNQKKKDFFLTPPPLVERFVFDFNSITADLFWIRTIQDMDFCENKDFLGRCKGNPWLFKMLEATSNIEPKYRIIYAAGGLILSVVINDKVGASEIFDRGVKEFPKDWYIAYRAAYHALYELDDYKKAADLLKQAGDSGAPSWVYSLSSRLYHQQGYSELAQRIISDLSGDPIHEKLVKSMKTKIYEKVQIEKVIIE